MALFALEETTNQCFEGAIYKGLRWIDGANELGVSMKDDREQVIWRCILPTNSRAKYWEILQNALGSFNETAGVLSLMILFEQRPYEFGWLLFALARKLQSSS